MAELTDEEKERLYLNPIVGLETQINNKIKGYSRFIEETEIFLETIKDISQQEFTDKYIIEFHGRVVNKKHLIVDIYEVLLKDWKQELTSAKKELASFRGEEYIEEDEEPDNIEPKKKKRFKIFEIIDNIISRVPKVVETIDTIKGKK